METHCLRESPFLYGCVKQDMCSIHLNPCGVHAFPVTLVLDFLPEHARAEEAYGPSR